MDIKADIKWIQSELNKVNDPDLVEIFKRLLLLRQKNLVSTVLEYNEEIIASEKDIEEGKLIPKKS